MTPALRQSQLTAVLVVVDADGVHRDEPGHGVPSHHLEGVGEGGHVPAGVGEAVLNLQCKVANANVVNFTLINPRPSQQISFSISTLSPGTTPRCLSGGRGCRP